MKLTLAMITLGLLFSFGAQANDGGIAAIKVKEIKMRETRWEEGEEKIVKKISNPSHTIIFEGGEAQQLQKVLPSQVSVITHMQPELEKDFNESFKTLGIYSDKSAGASAKAITINCEDAKLESIGETGKMKIVKTGKTVCKITIKGFESGESAGDMFGDVQKFEPKICQ